MKKIILVLMVLMITVTSVFAKKRDSLTPLTASILKDVEETYNVTKFKMPSETYETFDDKFVHFGEYNLKGGNQLVDSFILKEKRNTFTVKIQDASTTVSYGWEAYFKLINSENKVVQVIHKEDMEDAIYALYDCDYDGYDDLVFYTSKDKKGTMYHVYYWNPTMKRFEKKPDKLLSPYFDRKNKLVITSEVTGDAETQYEYFRYLGGGRKFVARTRITVPEGKFENGVSLAFTQKQSADFETSAGVYLFDLPAWSQFSNLDFAEKQDLVRQYNALMKKINDVQ